MEKSSFNGLTLPEEACKPLWQALSLLASVSEDYTAWDTNRVCKWVKDSMPKPQHAEAIVSAFQKKKVTGTTLVTLMANDLSLMGIKKGYHDDLLKKLYELRKTLPAAMDKLGICTSYTNGFSILIPCINSGTNGRYQEHQCTTTCSPLF